jgi:hypothetical protein
LPDGLFSNQKYLFDKIWMALELKMLLHIFNDLLEYFTAIWYKLQPFGIVYIYSKIDGWRTNIIFVLAAWHSGHRIT